MNDFSNLQSGYSPLELISKFIIRPFGFRFRPMVLYFSLAANTDRRVLLRAQVSPTTTTLNGAVPARAVACDLM